MPSSSTAATTTIAHPGLSEEALGKPSPSHVKALMFVHTPMPGPEDPEGVKHKNTNNNHNTNVALKIPKGCSMRQLAEVKADFEVWMPKLRTAEETLVAGHDFSPQWPGVVRAVHEQWLDRLALQHRPGQL